MNDQTPAPVPPVLSSRLQKSATTFSEACMTRVLRRRRQVNNKLEMNLSIIFVFPRQSSPILLDHFEHVVPLDIRVGGDHLSVM